MGHNSYRAVGAGQRISRDRRPEAPHPLDPSGVPSHNVHGRQRSINVSGLALARSRTPHVVGRGEVW
eukprot:3367500-Prymnesium_polylepis.1